MSPEARESKILSDWFNLVHSETGSTGGGGGGGGGGAGGGGGGSDGGDDDALAFC
jgi:hypothetical protein